jgi:hypothetical protein
MHSVLIFEHFLRMILYVFILSINALCFNFKLKLVIVASTLGYAFSNTYNLLLS